MFIVAGGNPWPPPLNDSPEFYRKNLSGVDMIVNFKDFSRLNKEN